MNPDIMLGEATALWLGILTSISPCPLATNIAAVSYVGRRVESVTAVLMNGVLYTAGRMLAYIAVSSLVVTGLLSIPGVSMSLQGSMYKALGPVLIISGVLLLDVFGLTLPGFGISGRIRVRVERWGIWGSFLLGVLFALAFCPVSAALFFGSLIPLAAGTGSRVILPAVYGLGTGLPVLFFAFLVAFGIRTVGAAFRRLSSFEVWARRGTGMVFIVVGVYLMLKHIFLIPLPF